MKIITLLSIVFLTFSTFASEESFVSNHECIGVYREGYVNLQEFIKSYNDEKIDGIEFSALLTGNSTDIMAHRTACFAFENPSVNTCVLKYKNLYKNLRSRVRLRSVLAGNQNRISYTEQSQKIHQVDQEQTTWYQELRNVLRNGSDATKEQAF